MKEKGGLFMALEIISATGDLLKESLQSVGIEKMKDKVAEFTDTNIRNPNLIKNIEEQLNSKYGTYTFYNDFYAYIDSNKTIKNIIQELSNIELSIGRSKKNIIERWLNDFCTKYKGYSSYDQIYIKNAFELIVDEVFKEVLCLNVHGDMGKLQASESMWFGQINEEQKKQTEMIKSIQTAVTKLENKALMTNINEDDFGQISEKVEIFLKKIDSVGSKDNPVLDSENALMRYQELSAEALIVLRGEKEIQLDRVICAINCHMAICYANLGNIEKALECLRTIPNVAAQQSKLYQFVNAVLIINYGLEEKYVEAEQYLNKALEIDSNYCRAFVLSKYLMALRHTASMEEILVSLDQYIENILDEKKQKEVMADYYLYRGFICKEFKKYDLAEKDFFSAKEYGYDESIIDYNLALLYYSIATQKLPKDIRLFCISIDASIMKKAIELLQKWLIDRREEKIPTHIKSRMVGIYVSSCVLLGIKHKLKPVDEYLKLPDLEYEVQRMLIMGADNITDKKILSVLDEDDALYVRIVNKLGENRYSDVKKLVLLMSEEEKKILPITTIYLILQASIANHDLEIYDDFRKYIVEKDAIGLVECIDAYANELNGEVEIAKETLDKYAISSRDYHMLCNIEHFYERNGFDIECEQLLLRILDLLEKAVVYVDDKMEFYRTAIVFLVNHKSNNARRFVDAIDIENEQMWRLKMYFYDKTKDIPCLLEMLTLLYQNTKDYFIGYNEIVCLMKLMKYDIALTKALGLLETVHENNIKDKIQVIWMISNLYLFLGRNQESFEWAKKAHELTVDIPNNVSHSAYLTRAIRVGFVDEALASILQYKEQHPVVISEWMKEVKVNEDNSGEEVIHTIENAVGHSHENYSQKEKDIGIMYRKGILPNSTILKRYGEDIVQFFIFAKKNKLRISSGSWTSIEEKKEIIGEHILVDVVTLIIMNKYGCLDALKKIKNIHICYATIISLQEIYLSLNYYYVEELLEWIGHSDNIIFESDGYCEESSMANIFSDEIMTCCGVASRLKIPFLTSEILLEDLIGIEGSQLTKGLMLVNIVALCYKTMVSEPDKMSQIIYNLLEECTFVNFTVETIIEYIKKNEYIISNCDLDRFFTCNTSCDMISFAKVYIGVVKKLKDQYYEASLDFSHIILENALRIWRKGTYYRSMSKDYNIESATNKAKAINSYLLYLVKGIQTIYGTVPVELEQMLKEINEKCINYISERVISEMMDTL